MEITKLRKLREVNNDMTHNWYYLCYARMLNTDKTRCRRFSFVVWFDAEDVAEFFDKDKITKKDIGEYAKEITNNTLPHELAYDDLDGIRRFAQMCRETIENYNNK